MGNNVAVLIADDNQGSNFSGTTQVAAPLLPPALKVTEILAAGQGSDSIRAQILTALNNGSLIVNYNGHGSTEQWSFSDLLDDSTATNLTNGGRLPVYFLMDCLNGFFQDVYTESLAESLLPAPHGGAVGVWASSGLTNAPLRRSSINPCFGRSLETRAGPSAPRCWWRNCWSPIPTFAFSVMIFSVVVQGLSIKPSFESWTSQATGSAIYYRRSAAPTRSMSDGGRCLR
jgi:hypothetical protein